LCPRAEAVAKKNGFASLAEYDDVWTNITMIISGIDPQTKKFTEPTEQIKKERRIKVEIETWGAVIRAANIKAQ
jgi:hypothetical protein